MAYQRKTRDLYILQSDSGYGQGWEDETTETSKREILKRLKEYQENTSGMQLRWIKRREPLQCTK